MAFFVFAYSVMIFQFGSLTKPSKAHGFNRGTNKYQNIYINSLRDMKS